MLDQHQDAARSGHEGGAGTPLYRRPMPGGGYVQVELDASTADAVPEAGGVPLRGRVVMERRADPGRRYGHRAPVVAELVGDDRDALMADLFELARDNAALARSLMQIRAAPERAD
ncbi:MAG TPA: hypothetical protein VJT85_05780 [Gemmatimonadaceae bacterium]|nr:hypothetical protein [Gemmatimonadaceae bacterium]